ncbi:MAG: hypothetical protein QM691_05575 [Opitutaceae bacterium]
MKTLHKIGLLFTMLASVALGADHCKKPHAAPVAISATIFGKFLIPADGGPAWAGHLLLKIGNGAVRVATFVDRGDGPPAMREDGTLLGTETITVSLVDGTGSFTIKAAFEAPPAATPGLFLLNEAGTISGGDGVFEGMTGHVTIKGPFVFPEEVLNPAAKLAPSLWIAQLRGRVRGIAE